MLKYAYQEDNFTVGGIKNFVDRSFAGKLIPFVISDPVAENEYEYENNVRVVVGEAFEKIVLDEHKDVLLFVLNYHDEYDPVFFNFLKLAIEDFVLAKIDLSTNEIDGIKKSYGGELRLYRKNLKHSPRIESFDDYPSNAETDINFYVQLLKRYAFLFRETHSKLFQSEPQVLDIISWAEQEPHPTCPIPIQNKHKWAKNRDEPNITDIVLSVAEGNFSKIVLDDENDVFLVAYILGDDITEFSKLAAQLIDVKSLVFAKIDSSVNEVAGVKECSSPIYWLYPRNQKHAPIIYRTNRVEESDFLFFLRYWGRVSIPFVPELESID